MKTGFLPAAMACICIATPVAAQEKFYYIDLPPQPLAKSLYKVAELTGLQLVFTDPQISQTTARPLVGKFTPSEMLGRLMQDTSYSYYNRGNVVRIDRVTKPKAKALKLSFAQAPVQAAEQEATPAPGQTHDSENPIEDIVVTARRTEEAAQSVPVALIALSQSALQRNVVLDIRDLQTSTPGLFMGTDIIGGSPTFAIRGAKADSGTSPTVAIYIDDVPVVSTLAVANMVYDMQSITTLKGPQGTLFGANSTGGAIIFRPNRPTDQFEGYIQAGYGNYDRKEFQGVINAPISDVVQVRIAGEIVRRDGFLKNISDIARPDSRRMDDDRHESARISVRLNLADTLTNDTTFDYYHVDGQPKSQYGAFFRPRYDFATFLGFSVPADYAKFGVTPLKPYQLRTSGNPFYNKGSLYGIANTTNWEINPDWSAKLVFGYRNDDTDESKPPVSAGAFSFDGRARIKSKQWTVEPSTTFNWGGGRWSNKVGFFFSDIVKHNGLSYNVADIPFDLTGVDPATAALLRSFYPIQANILEKRRFRSAAIYDHLSLELSNELTLRAGLRYTHDEAKLVVTNRNSFPMTPGGLGEYGDFNYGPCDASTAAYDDFDPVACTGTRSFKTNNTSFLLSLENKFTDRKMLYASLRGSYLVGGFNNPVPVREGQVFGPERVVAFEGGLKADWDLAARPLRTNIALFYGTYQGQQRVSNNLGENGLGYFSVENAGSTRFYGIDTDITFKPAGVLTLSAAYQYLVAEYTNYTAALSVPNVTASLDLTGRQESQAPEHVFSASATLDLPISENMGALSATLSYFYRSKTLGRDAPTVGGSCKDGSNVCTAPGTFIIDPAQDFTQYDVLPAFGIFNLSAQWKEVAGTPLDIDFYIKNLTDKLYYSANSNQAMTYGWATFVLGDPRTFGMRMRYSF